MEFIRQIKIEYVSVSQLYVGQNGYRVSQAKGYQFFAGYSASYELDKKMTPTSPRGSA
jgi:hypothetical protein